jgi:hypothetical protein
MASIEAIIVGIVDFKKNLMIVASHSPPAPLIRPSLLWWKGGLISGVASIEGIIVGIVDLKKKLMIL